MLCCTFVALSLALRPVLLAFHFPGRNIQQAINYTFDGLSWQGLRWWGMLKAEHSPSASHPSKFGMVLLNSHSSSPTACTLLFMSCSLQKTRRSCHEHGCQSLGLRLGWGGTSALAAGHPVLHEPVDNALFLAHPTPGAGA